MRLKDKVAIVTGGNSGIGRGIVHRFAAEGAKVAILARNGEKAAKVVAEVAGAGGEAIFLACELGNEDEVERAIAEVVRQYGRLDVVAQNAGVGGRRVEVQPQDRPGTRWAKMRGPDLDGPYYVCAHALPHLARTKGSIVVTTSTAAWHGNWGTYCIAKAGCEALVKAFACEGAPMGVRVNGVSPGWIAIERDAEASPTGGSGGGWQMPPSALGRVGTPAEIAGAVLFLASEDASYVTGQTLIVDGGLVILDYPSMPMLGGIQAKLYSQPVEE